MVSPPDMSLLPEFKAELDERNTQYREVESIEKCIADADVIYMEPVVQADYEKSRVDPSADASAHPGRLPGHPGAAAQQGQERLDHPALAAPDGRASPGRGRRPATTGTGPRPSTAWSCAWRCSPWSSARPGRGRPCRPIFAAATSSTCPSGPRTRSARCSTSRSRSSATARSASRTRTCGTRSWPCCSSSRAPAPGPRSRRAWPSSAGTPSSSTAGPPRSRTATRPRRSARYSAATTTASRSGTSTGSRATSTCARSPRPAGCPCSTCSATSTTRTRRWPT